MKKKIMKNTARTLIRLLVTLFCWIVTAVPAYAGNVSLAWDTNTSPGVIGYRMYYKAASSTLPFDGTEADQGNSPVDVGNTLTTTLTGLADGQTYYFTVTAYDAAGNESPISNIVSAQLAPSVPVNNPPVLAPIGAKTTAENALLSFALSATDPDGNSLTYSAANLPSGATFSAATRTFSWTPTYDQAGSYTVTFSVSDGSLSDSETVAISVSNSNRAPVLTTIGAKSVAENALLSFALSATDPDGNSLTYSAANLPSGATFSATTRTFSWTPTYDQAGSYTVTFSVSDGSLSDSEAVAISVGQANREPVISGTPVTSIMEGSPYSFTPTASDPDSGDNLTFTIVNKPSWTSFNTSTGTLSGTPGAGDVGTTSGIRISVSDGQATVSLSAFNLTVSDDPQRDSDGDGVIDSQDAFPYDASETIDTDLDGIGNNSDTDDDNDGIIDSLDAYPLDASRWNWVLSAHTTEGGAISPEGAVEVAFGGEQKFVFLPKKGYAVASVSVDGQSLGALTEYSFTDVQQNHDISVAFASLPQGLSLTANQTDLAGVERLDGGSAADNLIAGIPSANLKYRFEAVLRDSSGAAGLNVMLVLDGYPYLMSQIDGDPVTGATFARTLELGPAPAHSFHYEVWDESQRILWSYPLSGELPGPVIELLDGVNIVGIPRNIDEAGLSALQAFGTSKAYRWISKGISSSTNNGTYSPINSASPAKTGEGVFIKKSSVSALPDYSGFADNDVAVISMPLQPGWNLISNPFAGSISLEDLQVQQADLTPMSWLDATDQGLVVNAAYRYDGDDWGGTYTFSSAGGTEKASLVPWIGYWIYVNVPDSPVVLLLTNPGVN